ncbi:MAG: hypothetical protein HRT71_09405 [Flavobacteriales bacterium]|nr:hypothetical protein [Flavobacteriales bacterium]
MPRIGTRKLYYILEEKLKVLGIGRNKLFSILRANHLLIIPKRQYHITTDSHHRFRKHKNKIETISINRPEQVWVSDITYIGNRTNPVYLALITDAYSKKIVRHKLKNGKLSVGLAAGFSGNLINYNTEGLNAIGQQAKVIDVRPLVHYFANNGWFATGQVAYNYKFDPVPTAANASIKLDKAAAKYYFYYWYDYQLSFGGLDYRGIPAPTTFRELGVDCTKLAQLITCRYPINLAGLFRLLKCLLVETWEWALELTWG